MDRTVDHFRHVWLTLFVWFASTASALAQPPSAELAAILGKWKRAVSEPERYEIRGHRIIYNDVFQCEKWASLQIQYEFPQRVRFMLEPMDVPDEAISRRRNHAGRPFEVSSDGRA